MKTISRLTLCIGLLLLLGGCAGLPSLPSTPAPDMDLNSTPTLTVTPADLPDSQPTPEEERILRVWVPPQFAPSAEENAGGLLQARLDEFKARRPGLQIEVRVKAESGANGLLESLAATDAAAPAIMPDLVALPRASMEAAAIKGLLHPLDGLTTALDDPDWYPYSHQLARIQNTAFGLPFAGDALLVAGYSDPLPVSWDLLADKTLLFPAADPQAFFSLALYLSQGAALLDLQGQPQLEENATTDVLSFYTRLAAGENLSSTVLTYQDDAAAWQALKERRANMAAVWASSYLQERPAEVALALIPGLGQDTITLSRGYVWALAGSDPENQALAVELAEFLTASEFLAQWSEAAGALPTRPTALASWQDSSLSAVLEQAGETAQLVPSNDVTLVVGPALQQAVESVLTGEALPAEAARVAAEGLK